MKRRRVARLLSCTVFAAGVLLAARMHGAPAGGAGALSAWPDLGPNVLVFDPSMPAAEIQAKIDKIYQAEQHSEFGSERYALLFLPGKYKVKRADSEFVYNHTTRPSWSPLPCNRET